MSSAEVPPHPSRPETTGAVHSIETLGGADGPGLRAVVFLQGCPLRCHYCQNPDTWNADGGEGRTAGDLVAEVARCKAYFGERGGVTLSGGEPLLQPAFAEAIFAGCREQGIHAALDTSGCIWSDAVAQVLAQTDLVLLDIKEPDPARYASLTGGKLDTVLHFMEEVAARDIELWIRHVVVPGWNDTLGRIHHLAALLRKAPGIVRVDLLPYHTLGAEKWCALELPTPLDDVPALSPERLAILEEELASLGVPVALSG